MEIAVQKATKEGKLKWEEEMARQGINQYEILVEQRISTKSMVQTAAFASILKQKLRSLL